MVETMRWTDEGYLALLDQTKLPGEVCYVACRDYRDVAGAIKTMQVRGAPAIGAAAAYGMALGVMNIDARSKEELLSQIKNIGRELVSTRLTAVNLQWAVERIGAGGQGKLGCNYSQRGGLQHLLCKRHGGSGLYRA